MYGWRGRIGLLATAINTTMEPEFWQLMPPERAGEFSALHVRSGGH